MQPGPIRCGEPLIDDASVVISSEARSIAIGMQWPRWLQRMVRPRVRRFTSSLHFVGFPTVNITGLPWSRAISIGVFKA